MSNSLTEEGVLTLNKLVYRLRDTVGAIKNKTIEALVKFDSPTKEADSLAYIFTQTEIASRQYLRGAEETIVSTLNQIISSPQYQRLKPEEKKDLAGKIISLKNHAAKLSEIGELGTTALDLLAMDALAKPIYEKLHTESDIDELTGLRTQNLFEQLIHQRIIDFINDPTKRVTLAVIDLYNMKAQNDLNSYDQTNMALLGVAQGLKNKLEGTPGRPNKGGDEFYYYFLGADAEGAKYLLETKLIPYIVDELPTFVKKATEENGWEYKTGFEDEGHKICVGIGLSSTHNVPGVKPTFYERLLRSAARWLVNNRKNYPAQEFNNIRGIIKKNLNENQPLYRINEELANEDYRAIFRTIIYDTLMDEATKALHKAKNQMILQPNTNIVCTFDPRESKGTFRYQKK